MTASPKPYQARLLELKGLADLQSALVALDVDRGGINIMAAKGVYRLIRIDQVPVASANIIKQEALARGAELATPWTAATFKAPFVDVILMGTLTSLRSLVSKLYRQHGFDLAEIADAIQRVLAFTTPGYLPVARQVNRQGIVVEETLDDHAGGRIPLEPGTHRATGRPRSVLNWPWGERSLLVSPLSSLPIRSEREREGDPMANRGDEPPSLLTSGNTPAADLLLLPHDAPADQWERAASDGRPLLLRHEGTGGLDVVADQLWQALETGAKAGIAPERFLLDPGLDSGKTPEEACQITRRLTELTSFGAPLLWSIAPGLDPLAAFTLAVEKGAHGIHAPYDERLSAWIQTVDRLIREERPATRKDG
jgi:hypothetical protein